MTKTPPAQSLLLLLIMDIDSNSLVYSLDDIESEGEE
jgi:hypothetical protein